MLSDEAAANETEDFLPETGTSKITELFHVYE